MIAPALFGRSMLLLGSLLVSLWHPASAARPKLALAIVGVHRYALPRQFLDPEWFPREGFYRDMFDLSFMWPAVTPVPSGRHVSYADGEVVVSVQDLSPATRIEHLSQVPGERAKFLKLWRDSTVDQFALRADFSLAALGLTDTAEASQFHLRQLGGVLTAADGVRKDRLFADGLPQDLTVLMMCEAGLSCQLWWRQNQAAVEVTFDERFLPDWDVLRQSVTAMLDRMAAP